ncbi:MAG: DNA methyltransferase [Chloroflexota bacterium]|nr:DNA methyltransferase [Chloroflexota bacterium]
MRQLALLSVVEEDTLREEFSYEGVSPEAARLALETRYGDLLEETLEFDRQLVSFQANKTETLHSWVKYREGFSADLVESLLARFDIHPGDRILDPFAGSGTTLLVSQLLGIDAVGIDLLAHCHLAWEAKSQVFDYDLEELRYIRQLVLKKAPPATQEKFQHLRITWSAFPEQTERDLMAYTRWFEKLNISAQSKTLCKMILTSNLEAISYTRKGGQYLRWDQRAQKIRDRNKKRRAQGKKPIRGMHKGPLPDVREAFLETLERIILDVQLLQKSPPPSSTQQLIKGNALYELPNMEGNQFDGVITSPPYANRYDYTRTYALEEAYLGIGEEIFKLRQRQLSCTVENRSKLDRLEEFYRSIGQYERYRHILNTVHQNKALTEVNRALQIREVRGEINNPSILRMIEQYFTELTFVFAELYRTCKHGAQIAFVNDNVRYAGEVIPVDLLSTNLAEQVGFTPVKVYVLTQRKGNSSQQMAKYGRVALRKSVIIWQKE